MDIIRTSDILESLGNAPAYSISELAERLVDEDPWPGSEWSENEQRMRYKM